MAHTESGEDVVTDPAKQVIADLVNFRRTERRLQLFLMVGGALFGTVVIAALNGAGSLAWLPFALGIAGLSVATVAIVGAELSQRALRKRIDHAFDSILVKPKKQS